MIRKTGKWGFLALFVALLCLPHFWWYAFGGLFDSADVENRERASFPELTAQAYPAFAKDFEAYYNDNLPFRSALIALNSAVNRSLFRVSADDRVILGEDDWLFYGTAGDGNPIGDYQGAHLWSDRQLRDTADRLIAIRDELAEQGVAFAVFIAPNKERVYSEYLPERYGAPADAYPARQLVSFLRENTDLRVVYPYDEIMEAKDALGGALLYHKADTHWNLLGGYVGARALLSELGIALPAVTDESLSVVPVANASCDLANMLGLGRMFVSRETDYAISGYDRHGVVNEQWDPAIVYRSDADTGRLLVVRDSFCSAMAEVLGSQFASSRMIHVLDYRYEDYLAYQPDVFVLEVVERYLFRLSSFDLRAQ